MSKILPFLLLLLWLLGGAYWLQKRFCGASTAVLPTPTIETKAVSAVSSLLIQDAERFNTKANGTIDFPKTGFNHLALAPEVDASLKQTAEYLKNNPNRSMLVSGKYDESETYEGPLTNLGVSRANDVKTILTQLGAPGKQILLGGEKVAGRLNEDKFLNGASFSFAEIKEDSRCADLKKRLSDSPIVLYFPSGEDKISLDDQQRQDFEGIISCMGDFADGSVEIGGHTDNQGNKEGNMRLSRQRAKFVREYLVKNGFADGKLSANGYGPDKPISSNDTKEGKAQNRRVEVRLK